MRTVGVEEELLLVEPESGEPLSLATQVVRLAGADPEPVDQTRPGGTVERELQLQQIEVDTQPQSDLRALAEAVADARARAARAAAGVGAHVAALATSPLPVAPRTTPAARYLAMAERFGLTESEQLTCGLHVHVSVDGDEEGVAALDRIRVWLPVLLAISANSPFWQGVDSGYGSYRSQVWSRWPSAGPLPVLGSGEAYRERVRVLLASEVPMDAGMLYFDARLSAQYPTVEIRVADVCLLARDTVLVAALARALVDTAVRHWRAGLPAALVPTSLLRLAHWRASRSGLDDVLLDPCSGRPERASAVVAALLDHVREALDDAGDLAFVEKGLEDLLDRGPGALRQRAIHRRSGNLRDVVADAVRLTAR
ncbi:glutamate--cysteine ligase [Angustibacter sp. McL0619]|uniref:glutamate--cysteine ligase n=1 Tax=Angustibacter sp. McL0619 TaxID=3415676 RepID=UPI003CF28511